MARHGVRNNVRKRKRQKMTAKGSSTWGRKIYVISCHLVPYGLKRHRKFPRGKGTW